MVLLRGKSQEPALFLSCPDEMRKLQRRCSSLTFSQPVPHKALLDASHWEEHSKQACPCPPAGSVLRAGGHVYPRHKHAVSNAMKKVKRDAEALLLHTGKPAAASPVGRRLVWVGWRQRGLRWTAAKTSGLAGDSSSFLPVL